MARNKLTDKQKKKIVADYVQNQNYLKTAQMNGIKAESVRRIVKADKEFVKKSEQKKQNDTKDILEYMDTIKEKQKRIIDLSLEALETKLEKPDRFINVKDIATVYGVIFDKALKYKEIQYKAKEESEAKRQNGVISELIGALNKAKENKNE